MHIQQLAQISFWKCIIIDLIKVKHTPLYFVTWVIPHVFHTTLNINIIINPDHFCHHFSSVQQILNFPANTNRNRFSEPIFLQMGIKIVSKRQNLRIGIWIVFVKREEFTINSFYIFFYNLLFFMPFPLNKYIFFQARVWYYMYIFNIRDFFSRPDVAGAVLLTPL